MTDLPAIQTEKLEKRYGDLVALRALDLSIAPGERIALVGANGSGKTTFMRMIAGLIEASSGNAFVHGETAGSLEARTELSFIPDNPVLYDDLSVREHMEYLGALYGAIDIVRRTDVLLERLGLSSRADDLPSGFSRGLRQKTSLALGFLRPFSVLMVDEPFVGLDESGRNALLALLDETVAAGATVIVASHQLDLVSRASRCIALRDGEVHYDGPAGDINLGSLVGV